MADGTYLKKRYNPKAENVKKLEVFLKKIEKDESIKLYALKRDNV